MKKLIFFIFLLLQTNAFSQGGKWTWMGGDSVNFNPVFGTQGIPGPLNTPAGAYEAAQFVDAQGNGWIFDGLSSNSSGSNLWKYDHQLLQWVWVKGSGNSLSQEVFGVKGVPSPLNWPGGTGTNYSNATWTDLSGNFWMIQYDKPALWKYDVALGQWAWMSGDTIANAPPVHGVQGVPSPLNMPSSRAEHNNCWTDNAGNLWLFGGWVFGSIYSDTWKYDINTNEWTWMHGPNTPAGPASYGTKGVPDPSNNPGAICSHTKWKDSQGNLYQFGGFDLATSYNNSTWKYNIATNMWTWVNGPSYNGNTGSYGAYCVTDSNNLPAGRWEHSSCWYDASDNFWVYGGSGLGTFNDLWHYSPVSNMWTLVTGGKTGPGTAVFGNIGVADSANTPGLRNGSVSWMDAAGNLWLWGGSSSVGMSNDLWKFTFDTLCPGLVVNPQLPDVNLMSSDTIFCSKQSIDFTDLSTNSPTSWYWYFPGATPDTSTLQNPTGIYYPNYGSFDVALKACNANGCDSIFLGGFINELQLPPTPVVTQNGDTLFSTPAFSFQWYESTNPGNVLSTDSIYITTQSGNYYVIICDSFGCCSASNSIVIDGISHAGAYNSFFSIYPNPNSGAFILTYNGTPIGDMEIAVYNYLGEILFTSTEKDVQKVFSKEINLDGYSEGLYFVKVSSKLFNSYLKTTIIK